MPGGAAVSRCAPLRLRLLRPVCCLPGWGLLRPPARPLLDHTSDTSPRRAVAAVNYMTRSVALYASS